MNILNDDIIENSLSDLKYFNGQHAYRVLTIENWKLEDISLLSSSCVRFIIQKLSLSHNNLSVNSNISNVLSDFQFLLSLNLSHNKLKQIPFYHSSENHICKFRDRLEYLNLSHNGITDIIDDASKQLVIFKRLKTLLLQHNCIESLNGIIDMFKNTQFLSVLNLSYNQIVNINQLNDIDLPYLKELNLSHNQIKQFDLLTCKFPMLNTLDISYNQINTLENIKWSTFEKLRKLFINHNLLDIDYMLVEDLSKLPKLNNLCLNGNNMVIQREQIILELNNLVILNNVVLNSKEKIDIQFQNGIYKKVSDDIMKYAYNEFAKVKEDKCINEDDYWLKMCEKGMILAWEPFFDYVKQYEPRKLDLGGTSIGNVGLWAIGGVIGENPCISNVNLSYSLYERNSWSSKLSSNVSYGLKMFSRILASPTSTINTLCLSHCCIGINEGEIIASILEKSMSLANLDLSHNKLGQHVITENNHIVKTCPGLLALCLAVSSSSSLVSLNLSYNEIDEHGSKYIAMALMPQGDFIIENEAYSCLRDINKNERVKCLVGQLDISNNQLGEIGGYAITEALKYNNRLEKLNISNALHPKALDSLISVLIYHNRTIKNLDVSLNHFSNRTSLLFSQLFWQNNLSLNHLNLRGCDISVDDIKVMTNSINRASNQQCDLNLISLDLSDNPRINGKEFGEFLLSLSKNSSIMKHLEHLFLEHIDINEFLCQGLQDLMEHTSNLSTLVLSACNNCRPMEKNAMECLARAIGRNESLTRLQIGMYLDCKFTLNNVLKYLAESLETQSALVSFQLDIFNADDSITEIYGDTLEALSHAFHIQNAIQNVTIPSWNIQSAPDFGRMLLHLNEVTELNIQNCKMNDALLRSTVLALRQTSVKKLNMSNCLSQCSSEEVNRCLDILLRTSITSINLSKNSLSPNTIEHICNILVDISMIKVIDLSGNTVEDSNIQNVVKLIKSNQSIQNLKLPHFTNHKKSVQLISQNALRFNTSLKVLIFDTNKSLTYDERQHILAALTANNQSQLKVISTLHDDEHITLSTDHTDLLISWKQDRMNNNLAAKLALGCISNIDK